MAMVSCQQPVTRGLYRRHPPFLQIFTDVGEEKDEFSPRMQINLPKEARHTFVFYIYTMYMNNCLHYVHIYKSPHSKAQLWIC